MQPTRQTGLLVVDLTEETVTREAIPASWLDRYVGGKGLGARYLYRELDPGVNPLSAESALLFMVGPLTGLTPGEPRYVVVTKSPLTGGFLDSYSGGAFAARLAGSLGDSMGLLIRGAANRPVSIVVEDGWASIDSATRVWGQTIAAVDASYSDAAVACIGPAGEREVVYATFGTDGGDHQAGRGGAGAVLGAKSVKSILAMNGPREGLEALCASSERDFLSEDRAQWTLASETAESIDFADEAGVLASNGWTTVGFDETDSIGIESVRAATIDRERSESTIPGGFRVSVGDESVIARGAMQMSLGAGLGIDDIEAVLALGGLCDRLGLDVIGVGNAVAWAIRAGRAGIVDFDGEFGDAASAASLIEAIAYRSSDLGTVLADGLEAAGRVFGGRSMIPTVKGMSVPGYDPRRVPSMALAYATSDRGACHRRARPIETAVFRPRSTAVEEQARRVVEEQTASSVRWSLVVDDFLGPVFEAEDVAAWLRRVGYDVIPASVAEIGERIWNLTRLFNVREGYDRRADEFPPIFTEAGATGDAAVEPIDPEYLERLLDAYYERLGWDRRGIPRPDTRERLGLSGLEVPAGSETDTDSTG